ncbi:MAG TPA: phenylalanine--tRNA ligase subunit alpha [Gemmatimonadaceae bacterium]|nr:phenylalanine--tRNA ligase subunit alpha [Gemmatimonadaceae bacterium]
MDATLTSLIADADALERQAREALSAVTDAAALEALRVDLVGRKAGRVNALLQRIPTLPPESRAAAGQTVNRIKAAIEQAIDERSAALTRSAPAAEEMDLTMPARHAWHGSVHPVTLVLDDIERIFRALGFTVALGPEAETEWYNFQALNFPPEHPAMDMHDTLYLGGELLLRTHTSPVQVRTLQRFPPPVRVIIPGNVYRRDPFDASHAPMFSQLEGLAVDEGISFVDLKATLTYFARALLGPVRTRFRPSYFPFTEPSAEMDVECVLCAGAGCSACKQTGWMEILGSGMVHPAVLEAAGLDSERYTGWAFGMGPGRIAMLRYGIPDIRLLYDSDLRFLEQFST